MTLQQFARLLHLTQRTVRDVDAVRKGRVGERVANRLIGKVAGNVLRGVWR